MIDKHIAVETSDLTQTALTIRRRNGHCCYLAVSVSSQEELVVSVCSWWQRFVCGTAGTLAPEVTALCSPDQ
jgi:hypothetical protein